MFVLSFSIIMLNTNLHSVKVKDKMTISEFLRQNRDTNGGENFPGDFLVDVFNHVAEEELKVMG